MRVSRRHFSLLAATSLSVAAPARAYTASEQELTCPVDGAKLWVSVTMSYTTFGQLRDFAVTGAIGNLYASYVHACPKCRFAGYADEFEKPVSAATKTWQRRQGRRRWGLRQLSDAQECEAAADRYVFEQRRPRDIAQLYLVGSYVLRDEQGRQLVKRKELQRAASLYLLAALAAGDVEVDKRGRTTYLVAELERRIGRFEDAISHYGAALQERNNPAGLVTWIEEQRALAEQGDSRNDI
jgi:uncharacterized protein (DUF2225 family)